MVNNINSYTSLFNTNSLPSSSTSEVEKIILAHKNEATVNDESNTSTNTSLNLSSRAQKVSALSNEFFSGGDLSFNDVDALKERIYQFGLISKEEYAGLTKTTLSEEDKAASKDVSSQNLASFLGDFLDRLDETKAGKTDDLNSNGNAEESEILIELKVALLKAKDILADVDKEKSDPKFKESLMNSLSFIKDTINTKAYETMQLDDKVGLGKVYQALEVVDKMSPQRLTNEKLNRYMKVAFQ